MNVGKIRPDIKMMKVSGNSLNSEVCGSLNLMVHKVYIYGGARKDQRDQGLYCHC